MVVLWDAKCDEFIPIILLHDCLKCNHNKCNNSGGSIMTKNTCLIGKTDLDL